MGDKVLALLHRLLPGPSNLFWVRYGVNLDGFSIDRTWPAAPSDEGAVTRQLLSDTSLWLTGTSGGATHNAASSTLEPSRLCPVGCGSAVITTSRTRTGCKVA